mmetsp:Transcript_6307/g.9703  ORF Transcript_6307/g.9703 Transcript_6307/m.9703 type:complete len:604 (+) Transcript_6307:167-1978(+)|eukprot:CAMPEP_0178907410 /NCGR_PEP_ID=MMETSP0786-20121207/7357_1 /TAXON_ID=186022 /ORGANISM="Thalassionema frauenfeldii, Strain CCMP 1798" /LENGTH=603 /DNA_ID=CAMNT_0020579209 /DNA_START=107 /DNA_END=1918 /DNA_ORIENTATION=-
MTTSLKAKLETSFANAGLTAIPEEILSKCLALSTAHGIEPTQLAEVWEAHSINKNISELTDHTFPGYRAQVMKDFENNDSAVMTRLAQKRTTASSVTPSPTKRQAVDVTTSAVDNVATSVAISPEKMSMPKCTYDDRSGVGKVVVSFGQKKNTEQLDPSLNRVCTISSDFDTNIVDAYRHMNYPLEERAKVLEEQLVTMGDAIISQYTGDAEIEAVGVPRQDKILCVGRICNEAHEGRLNATSLMLEGSRLTSNGARVHLDVSDLKKPYSLFPGQIVAVEGTNVTGRKLVAENIFEGARPSVKPDCDVDKGDLQIMAVAGPFTTSDNFDYAPMRDLIEVVRTSQPDVVILSGPFVDIEQGDPELDEDGNRFPVTYEVLFANKIAVLLEELFEAEESLTTQFVLIPSLRDAVAEWVFPQAPLKDSQGPQFLKLKGADGIEFGTLGLQHVETAGQPTEELQKRVHCFSNPCTFQINDIVVGIISHDVLMDLSAEETNGNLAPGTRLLRLSQHLIQQRCYYPLFPASNINLNLEKSHGTRMPCEPDLLILPSKLTSFAKPLPNDTCLVINPGPLSKGSTGGTYAIVDIKNSGDKFMDRVGVGIKKI